ncbi:MAG: M14 family metallopeptidase [Ideonella sp.]
MVDAETATALFSQSYAEARGKFLTVAGAAGLGVDSLAHPLMGRDGEPLALDFVIDGAPDSGRQLIISSGCHGVEGFCGSAVQTMLMGDDAFRSACQAAQVSVLYLHALNPWGFSWWRRTTHENIDLNRNFLDFSQPLPANPGYDELAPLLIPPHWPAASANQAAIGQYIMTRGLPTLQAAVSGGQYAHPDGLFYGGDGPSWSNQQLRTVLRKLVSDRQRVAWIDLHTGLGPCGVGERILAAPDDPTTLARTRRWWGAGVTSIGEGNSSSAPLEGLMFQAVVQECPAVEYTGIALEFGTVPLLALLDALRADQWLQNHADSAGPELTSTIKQQLRDAFYVDSVDWKRQVLTQAAEAAQQAVIGLAEV